MATSANRADDPLALRVRIDADTLIVELRDGRTIEVPVSWYPRLAQATDEERRNWSLIGDGQGIHWPALDEDISVEGLLAGRRSGESAASFSAWLAARSS